MIDINERLKLESYVNDWNYVYSFAYTKTNKDGSKMNTDKISCDIADAVMKHSKQYNLDPQIVARKIWKETWYNQWARSFVTDRYGRYVLDHGKPIPLAWGLAQINLEYNWEVIKKIDHGRWAQICNTRKDAEYLIWNININIEVGCYILSNYLETHGNYESALTCYWAGQNSTQFRDFKWFGIRNQYIDEILNPAVFEYNAALYHGYKFIERKSTNY